MKSNLAGSASLAQMWSRSPTGGTKRLAIRIDYDTKHDGRLTSDVTDGC